MRALWLLVFGVFTLYSYAQVPFEDTMEVLSVTYGGNCGGYEGNVTNSMRVCNGFESCNYQIIAESFGTISGLNPHCQKDLLVRYMCGKDTVERQAYRYPETNTKTIYLTCRNDHPRILYKEPIYRRGN